MVDLATAAMSSGQPGDLDRRLQRTKVLSQLAVSRLYNSDFARRRGGDVEDSCRKSSIDRDRQRQSSDGFVNELNLLQRMRALCQPGRVKDINRLIPDLGCEYIWVQVIR